MLLVIRKTLMMTAAVRQQPTGTRDPARRMLGVVIGVPLMCGMTATPVSKPDRPRASLGKTSRATATTMIGLPCWVVSAVFQSAPELRDG